MVNDVAVAGNQTKPGLGQSPNIKPHVFFDKGAFGVGKNVSFGAATHGVCDRCHTKTLVARKAWFRKTRPMCACGGVLDLEPKHFQKVFGFKHQEAVPV